MNMEWVRARIKYILWGMRIVGAAAIVSYIFVNKLELPLIGVILLLLSYVINAQRTGKWKFFNRDALDVMQRNLERNHYYVMEGLPYGVGVFNKEGKMLWHNDFFAKYVRRNVVRGMDFTQILPSPYNDYETLSVKEGERLITIGPGCYRVFFRPVRTAEGKATSTGLLVYMWDRTEEEAERKKYDDNMLCIAQMRVDNYDDVARGLYGDKKLALNSAIAKIIQEWALECKGFVRRSADDIFVLCLTKKALTESKEKDFPILDKMRAIKAGNKIAPTISIGIGYGEKSYVELSKMAQDGLERAIDRGGDQVAVLGGPKGTEYYGARKAVQAKSSKVQARMTGNRLRELMSQADKIFIMGHVAEDYDAIGASVGIAVMAKYLKKEFLIVDSGKGDARQRMLEAGLYGEDGYDKYTVSGEEALSQVTEKSLLILVDHHRAALAAAPELLGAIYRKVIIDHHRMAEDVLTNTEISYIVASSSSTSELVTELIHYFSSDIELSNAEAGMLYSGIVLDTKEFSKQTGERTFTAAAYLRKEGAEPDKVKVLFREPLAIIQSKLRLVADMEVPVAGLGISVLTKIEGINPEVVCAKAADDIIDVDDIRLSVVLYRAGEVVKVKARSDGSANAETLMKGIGGGGHLVMAAAAVKGQTLEEVKAKIILLAQAQLKVAPATEACPKEEK